MLTGKGPLTRREILMMGVLIIVWYLSASVGTITNKMIVESFPYPVILSASHLLSGAFVDYLAVRARGLAKGPIKWDLLISSLPVSFTLTFAKTLTFVSYEWVPASLTHTVKSSSPVFSVIFGRFVTGHFPDFAVCLSLVPITLGVTLSAFTEVDFELIGFLAALVATMANVSHAGYSKQVLRKTGCDPLVLHMYTSTVAFCLLVPYAIFKDFVDIRHHLHPVTTGVRLSADNAVATQYESTEPDIFVPVFAFFLSNLLHYLQNVTSLFVLARVGILSYQVANVLKRAFIIVFSVLYFHNDVAIMNWLGMAMALAGFFLVWNCKRKCEHDADTVEREATA